MFEYLARAISILLDEPLYRITRNGNITYAKIVWGSSDQGEIPKLRLENYRRRCNARV
jgi:hypothetical protein